MPRALKFTSAVANPSPAPRTAVGSRSQRHDFFLCAKGVCDAHDLNVIYGYSKNGCRDLKQIVIDLGVTPERLPFIGKIEDGNLNDKTWNTTFIKKLREVLSHEEWNGLTYVADSS